MYVPWRFESSSAHDESPAIRGAFLLSGRSIQAAGPFAAGEHASAVAAAVARCSMAEASLI